jgi:hypothetical protein
MLSFEGLDVSALKKIIQAGNTLRVVTFLKTLATIFAS